MDRHTKFWFKYYMNMAKDSILNFLVSILCGTLLIVFVLSVINTFFTGILALFKELEIANSLLLDIPCKYFIYAWPITLIITLVGGYLIADIGYYDGNGPTGWPD